MFQTKKPSQYKVYSSGVTLKEHQEEIQQAKTNLESKNCKIQEVRMRESSIVNLKYANNNIGDFLSVIYYLTII